MCAFNILGTKSATVCRLCRDDSVYGFWPKMSTMRQKLMVMKKKHTACNKVDTKNRKWLYFMLSLSLNNNFMLF